MCDKTDAELPLLQLPPDFVTVGQRHEGLEDGMPVRETVADHGRHGAGTHQLILDPVEEMAPAELSHRVAQPYAVEQRRHGAAKVESLLIAPRDDYRDELVQRVQQRRVAPHRLGGEFVVVATCEEVGSLTQLCG